MANTLRSMRTASTVLVVAALALIWASATGTLGGFSTAKLANPTDTVSTASLSFTHSQGSCSGSAASTSPVSCLSSVLPTTSSGTVVDTITDTGTLAPTVGRVRIIGCSPVSLADTGGTKTSGAMLPRTGVTFDPTSTGPSATTGYLTYASSGYASAISPMTEPTGDLSLLGKTSTYNLGIWFRTSSSAGGALFGFGSNPLAVSGTNNRILYLDASGKISFIVTSGTATTAALASGVSAGYNDGAWHFADVVLTASTAAIGIAAGWSATVYVDDKLVNSVSSATGALAGTTGYWHAGWSPLSGGLSNYFRGSLADFAVNDSSSSTRLTSTTSLTSASTQTDYWAMNDSGGALSGTTLSGVLPANTTLPTTSIPCADVSITWTTANPTSTVTAGSLLSVFASTNYTSISTGPAVGAAQTSTIALTRTNAADTYATGLMLYAPVQFDFSNGTWDVQFSYQAPAAGSAVTSTIVMS